MKAIHIRAALILLLALGAAREAAAQVSLQYRWKQGEAVTYRTSLKTDSTMSGMPGGSDVTLTQTMTQRIKLLPAAVAPDGAVTLHQTIEAVKIEMQTMMGTISYDSENPTRTCVFPCTDREDGSVALGRVFGAIVGTTVSVVMAPSGAIQRIDGVQKVYEKVTRDLPNDRSATQMAQTLKSVLSEPAIRAALEQSFPRLPAQPVKTGDTWNGQVSLGSDAAGRISGTQTMTLTRLDETAGAATIGIALTFKQESAPPLGPAGMTMKLGESKGEGQLEFDVANGRIRKSTMKTELPSTMTGTGPDGRPVSMKNTTKTSMTMEEIK